jgi:hypothetical protein
MGLNVSFLRNFYFLYCGYLIFGLLFELIYSTRQKGFSVVAEFEAERTTKSEWIHPVWHECQLHARNWGESKANGIIQNDREAPAEEIKD